MIRFITGPEPFLRRLFSLVAFIVAVSVSTVLLPPRNSALIQQIIDVHHLNSEQQLHLNNIFNGSDRIGTGNPAVTQHPMTEAECLDRQQTAGITFDDVVAAQICGAPYMAPLYDPETQTPSDASTCIDIFEFPDIPCTYPVVWVHASEAAQLCEAMGKRLCDAHEWEGACAGDLEPPDYRFDLAVGQSSTSAVQRMRAAHNAAYSATRSWSYGPTYQEGICATGSSKTAGCGGGEWDNCGSNTYPSGSFPDCHSSFGVYDLNGNAAEHMNLPLSPSQMSSQGTTLGVTEMKGSWFIFDSYQAHEDWCRWRAPFWHGTKVMDPESHFNYHLSFRCCKTL